MLKTHLIRQNFETGAFMIRKKSCKQCFSGFALSGPDYCNVPCHAGRGASHVTSDHIRKKTFEYKNIVLLLVFMFWPIFLALFHLGLLNHFTAEILSEISTKINSKQHLPFQTTLNKTNVVLLFSFAFYGPDYNYVGRGSMSCHVRAN